MCPCCPFTLSPGPTAGADSAFPSQHSRYPAAFSHVPSCREHMDGCITPHPAQVSSLILPSVPLTGCDCQAPPQRCRHQDDHLCGSHRVMTPSALQEPKGTCPSHSGERRGKVIWGGFYLLELGHCRCGFFPRETVKFQKHG